MGSRNVSLPSLGVDEKILSIVLSRSELAELDLSKLELFQTSAAGNETSNEPEPVVYKSRGAIEAEKSEKKKKQISMDHRPRPPAMQRFSRNSRQDAQPEIDPKPEETAKLGIDLKSSQASKFLVPWELQPSPLTPLTPAAVAFKWEEEPGKPKERAPDTADRRSPRPQALHLPPRLLQRTTYPPSPPEEADARHRRSGSAGSADEKRVICVQPPEKLRNDRRPGCLISSLDCQLAIYSPLRALGPPSPEDLNWGAKASALIAMWRKNSNSNSKSSAKHKMKNPSDLIDNMKCKSAKSFDPSGERLMDEATKTRTSAHSLNAVIAVAMGAKPEDFSSMTPSYQSLDRMRGSDVYCSNLVHNTRRKRRRWVLGKLRRPARIFRTFFGAVWRAVRVGKSRHRSRGIQRFSYESLRGCPEPN